MSVLNQSGEEQVECPLCMEPLEVDDLNFFPCTCGYQICRFCWHRIRTDENGLCPACRKAYSEDPADFVPLSREQLAQLKAEKRARDQRRKAKLTEGRKHLASVRVVQRNLVFVVGLPMRLADAEILKRHEYFGKFGKIHKVVINQSTSYAGSQGPSASAYVTYMKSDDALRAIQAVNNIVIDGRLIKSSLGTTKYCSHFMKNQPCPKPDCMYLHEYGDSEASFTKEQMHAGKHQEYEKKLHDELNVRTKQNSSNATTNNNNNGSGSSSSTDDGKTTNSIPSNGKHGKEKEEKQQNGGGSNNNNNNNKDSSGTNKENWPQLNLENKDKKEKEKGAKKGKTKEGNNKKERRDGGSKSNSESSTKSDRSSDSKVEVNLVINLEKSPSPSTSENLTPPPVVDDNSSFFSSNSFQKVAPERSEVANENAEETTEQAQPQSIFTDSLPDINTTEDWAAAFGFSRHHESQNLEEIKRREVKNNLTTFGNGFGHLAAHENAYNKDTFNGFYEVLDVLSNKMNGVGLRTDPPHHPNGLDQNMSKFFTNFQEKMNVPYQNGYAAPPTNFPNVQNHMMLQQKQLEEQILNLSLAAKGFPNVYQNGAFLNGDNGYNGPHNHLYGMGHKQGRNAEDELDFDPIQETQKAFEELMACEGARKGQAGRTNQMNGVIHSPTGAHLPPPPGFLQPQNNGSHMNSFGSKFLPFLNMSSGQPQVTVAQQQQHGWPSNFAAQPPLPQQKKAFPEVSSACNDWKVLDPAILSASSRHFPVPPQPPREPYAAPMPQQRFEYANGASFAGFVPPAQAYGSYQGAPPTWFGGAEISSPPGFRSGQTKQQEC